VKKSKVKKSKVKKSKVKKSKVKKSKKKRGLILAFGMNDKIFIHLLIHLFNNLLV